MKKLFYPESIAVIGVSESATNFGKNIVKNLLDFQFDGKIYPVGQKEGQVFGLKIYQNIDDIPGKVELAVFLIPAKIVPEMMRNCAKKGIKRICISSGGFSEFGEGRKELEKELLSIAKENDIRFLGPNCIALINQDKGVCLPFVKLGRFKNGNISMLTQSGGVGLSFIYSFNSQNLGINKYVSLGNKLNISEYDIIPFLEEDESTEVIGFYLEAIEKGREFMDAVRGCKKPVVVMKSNTTSAGAKTAASHTAAIANDDSIVDCALRQVGIPRVRELDEMAPTFKAFQMPPMRGNRVAVITPTGGYAVILADLCEKNGFVLPEFPQGFIDDVSRHVRAGVINLQNPLDLGDMFDLEMVAHTIMRALQEETIDALLLSWIYMRNVGLNLDTINVFPLLDSMLKKIPKPVLISLVGDSIDVAQIQKNTNFPIFSSPEESVHALAKLRDFHANAIELRTQQPVIKEIDEEKIRKILDRAKTENRNELGMESLEILQACGIPVSEYELATNEDQAVEIAERLGYPVALKISSPDILHKTEVKGIRLNVKTEAECRECYRELISSVTSAIPDARIEGEYVQKMASGGRELLIGAKHNEAFGPVVIFGIGGIMVEAIGDIAMRVAPIGPLDAEIMMGELKAGKFLGKFRGMKPIDSDSIKDILYRVSTLVVKFPEIKELDINPVIAFEKNSGSISVDSRIILG
ncbi:MAG TPA: acetate--CoA ligase family protein [bacterium]|nr:acetate--CoA ligase family protein [bacterium]